MAAVIDSALEQKLPLRISWGRLHRRAVAATIAEFVIMTHDINPRPQRDGLMPAPDIVKSIDDVLRRKLPRRVKWGDELESNIVAYAIAEQIVRFFELQIRPKSENVSDEHPARPDRPRLKRGGPSAE